MAGQVPMTPPPAYAQQFGQMLQQTGSNRADVLGAELESNSANLGHILSNSDKIAEVGGGQFTLDRLLASYAGSKEDQIDDNYSAMADRRRAALEQAKIAALGRSGRGGGRGGKGDDTGIDVGQFVGSDGNVYKWSDYNEAKLAGILDIAFPGVTPVKGGPTYQGGDVTLPTANPNEVYDADLNATFTPDGALIRQGK